MVSGRPATGLPLQSGAAVPKARDMNPVFTFAKKVKEASIRKKDITDPRDISKLAEVIGRLEGLPKASVSRLDEVGLRTNPKKWVASLLQGYPKLDAADMENLLLDFTDAMQTRMREETKYALGLLMETRLLLCHTIYGEETITPEWKSIPRMLDTDNVLRYVSFAREQGDIIVKYWERQATSSFIEWLGLPRKQAFLFGGKYAICSEIDSITMELQLTETEIERWLREHPELKEGKVNLSSPIRYLTVSEIRAGRKHYENPEDFIQDYEAEKYGVPRYQSEYERLKSEELPLLMKYYDEGTRVVRKEGDEEIVEVEKSTPGFEILFADGRIEIRASYLDELARRILNGESVKAFHAGHRFHASPLVLGSVRIYNQLRFSALASHVIDYYNATSFQDRTLDALLKYIALSLLAEANPDSPIKYVLTSLSQEMVSELTLRGRLSQVEGQVLEYKSRDMLAGKDKAVVEKLASDIQAKLRDNPFKVYIVGAGDDGSLDPVPVSRLKSDRIDAIRQGLLNRLSLEHIYLLPAVQGREALLFIIALRS